VLNAGEAGTAQTHLIWQQRSKLFKDTQLPLTTASWPITVGVLDLRQAAYKAQHSQ